MNQPARTAPSVALVVPTYNRADLIADTLRSALAQRVGFDQIVVVDNGSTDHTAQVLAAFGSQIEVVRTANVGVQAARNLGVEQTRTRLVVLCDSDDLLDPGYLEAVHAVWLREPAVDAAFSNFVTFGVGGEGPDKLSQAPAGWFGALADRGDHWMGTGELYGATVRFQPLFSSGVCFDRTFYLRLGGYDTAFRGIGAEDWEFTLRVCAEGSVALIKAPLVRIRRHAGNDSANALHMNLGEAQVLRHALARHPAASRWRDLIALSIDERLHRAFDGAYAQGDFAQAADIVATCSRAPAGLRASVKRGICALPAPLRQFLWRMAQGSSRVSRQGLRITVAEPAWDHHVHLAANAGLIETLAQAYPQASLHFVGGAAQIDALRAQVPVALLGRLKFIAWQPAADTHPNWQVQCAARARWRRLPRVVTDGADLIVLSSATPTALTAVAHAGWATKACAVLHGNASELGGWRSRNPLRSALDFTAAMRRFCRSGGHIAVLEPRIMAALQARAGWLAGRMVCLPHPLPPTEARADPGALVPGKPVRVGFLGMATRAKGFLEFLELASLLHRLAPGRFEFHAIGMIHPTLKDIDQSALATPAAGLLDRERYLEAMRQLDWGFTWHHDDYYAQAASGVVYDAVNQLLPLIARDGAQLAAWHNDGFQVGVTFADVPTAAEYLATSALPELATLHARAVADLQTLRHSLDIPALAANLRRQLGPLASAR